MNAMLSLLFRFWPRSRAGAPVMIPAVSNVLPTNSRRVIWRDRVLFVFFFMGVVGEVVRILRGEYSSQPLRQIGQPCAGISSGLLGDGPASVADVIHRLHDRRPIVVAFQQAHRPWSARWLVALPANEFLDMELLNAFAQNADPLFRPAAVTEIVAHIKMPTHELALEFIHIACRLQRAEQKLVPNVFDGDRYPQF